MYEYDLDEMAVERWETKKTHELNIDICSIWNLDTEHDIIEKYAK